MSTELLKRCPLFAGLKEEDLKRIRAVALLKQVGKKQILFGEGEEARGFYVILSGKVKLYKISPEGKEQILHVVSAPDAFAEAALFLEGSYPAFAEALADSQLLFFPKKDCLPFSILKKICISDRRTLPERGFVKSGKVSHRSLFKVVERREGPQGGGAGFEQISAGFKIRDDQ